MFRLLIVSVFALSLAACSAVTEPSPVATTSDSVVAPSQVAATPSLNGQVIDDKAAYAVEVLYSVPASIYVAADSRGRLTPELKARYQPRLVELYALLKKAREAKAIGDSVNFNIIRDTMQRVSTSLSNDIPK